MKSNKLSILFNFLKSKFQVFFFLFFFFFFTSMIRTSAFGKYWEIDVLRMGICFHNIEMLFLCLSLNIYTKFKYSLSETELNSNIFRFIFSSSAGIRNINMKIAKLMRSKGEKRCKMMPFAGLTSTRRKKQNRKDKQCEPFLYIPFRNPNSNRLESFVFFSALVLW